MSNEFRGTGNVGDQPVLRTAMVSGNPRQVTELRVFFDEYRQDGSGGLEQTVRSGSPPPSPARSMPSFTPRSRRCP